VGLCVELKTDPGWTGAEVDELATAVVDVLDRHEMVAGARLLGFDWRVLAATARLAAGVARVALAEAATLTPDWLGGLDLADFRGDLAAAATRAGASTLSPEHRVLTAELVESAHANGLPVVVWTVNEPAEMRRFAELGVDGIVTDYPDRLRAVLASYGCALPPPRQATAAVTASRCAGSRGRAAGRTRQ
jgi:glycerophosphoryl diester phosphodiesterase